MNNNYETQDKNLTLIGKPISQTVVVPKINNEREAIVEALQQRRKVEAWSKDALIVERLKALSTRCPNKERYDLEGNLRVTNPMLNKAENYSQCGELVETFKCPECNSVRYLPRSSCNMRICENCCKKLFYKLWENYYKTIKHFKNPKLITLTFGSTPMLYPQVVSEFRRMFFRFRKRLKIKSGVYVFEVKRSPARIEEIEVHIHALVDSAYIPQNKTSQVWFETSGRFITDIRKAYSQRKGLGYIMKYVLKPPSFPIARDYASYEFMFDNRRRIQGFGCCVKTKTSLVVMEITCLNCGSTMKDEGLTSCWILENRLRTIIKGVGVG